MTFNTSLSGLRTANQDLAVTGNNIANASTVGFKESRAEFADVYATNVLGSGSVTVGSGVVTSDVAQQFSQGTIKFTENVLDLAINGRGFFQLQGNEGTTYTRAGVFGLDDTGYIVDNFGNVLQGYQADDSGELRQVPDDLVANTSVIPGHQTLSVEQGLNLDSSDSVIVELQDRFVANTGSAVAAPINGTTNGYLVGDVILNGDVQTGLFGTTSPAPNLTAAEIAAALNNLDGVSATAETTVTLDTFNVAGWPAGGLTGLVINSIPIDDSANLTELAEHIREAGFVVTQPTAGSIEITATSGTDITVDPRNIFPNPDLSGQPRFNVTTSVNSITVDNLPASGNQQPVTVGGVVTIDTDVNVTLESANTVGDTVWAGFIDDDFLRQPPQNAFDPNDADTYNFATSLEIYDTLGIPHVMNQYFVKEPVDPQVNTPPNTWTMYVQIDGKDVGGTNVNNPTQASFQLFFNRDGTLDSTLPDQIVISNWDPSGDGITGSEQPALPDPSNPIVTDPPTSSNFVIDLSRATQFGGDYSVNFVDQDGYAQGRLSSLNVDGEGAIFARFTNGESQLLGQVILADFTNPQGLQPIGNTSWLETFDSGVPIVGTARSGLFGSIQAGALEESNTDLSEQLVNLIIAQRNFQANAKTIETANQITQTIINLR